jgi:hypothetical protein
VSWSVCVERFMDEWMCSGYIKRMDRLVCAVSSGSLMEC